MKTWSWVALVAMASAVQADVGLKVGANVPAYDLWHVTGPDKGTETCPVCTYVNRPMVQVFVRTSDPNGVRHLIAEVDRAARINDRFRGFVVFLTTPKQDASMRRKLAAFSMATGFTRVALCTLAKPKDALEAFDLPVRGGFQTAAFVHVNRQVTARWLDMPATDSGSFRQAIESVVSTNPKSG